MRAIWAWLIIALMIPLATADDPDPPEFVEATTPTGDLVNGGQGWFNLTWQDASGLDSIEGYVRGPNDLHVWARCDDPEGLRVVTVTCRFDLPERAPGGTYTLSSSRATDVVGHYAYEWLDLSFNVTSPHTDTSPPQVTGFTINITDLRVDDHLNEWGYLQLDDVSYIAASDEGNVTWASAYFDGPGGGDLWVQCSAWENGACTLYGDPDLPAGNYTLQGMSAQDDIGYFRYYYYNTWDAERDLGQVVPEPPVIHLITNKTDVSAPVLEQLIFPGEVHRGQPFNITAHLTDETSVDNLFMRFRTTRGNAPYYVSTYRDCTGDPGPEYNVTCTGRFPDNFPLGLAILESVSAYDAAGNYLWAHPISWLGWGDDWFVDSDQYDIGVVLTARPVEGIIEAVDAIKNEVVQGDMATIVYQAEDNVDNVTLTLENEVGETLEIACDEVRVTDLGDACDVLVPETDGVFELRTVAAKVDDVIEETAYEPGHAVLAVATPVPAIEDLPLANGGGDTNNVGSDYLAARSAAAPKEDDPQVLISQAEPVEDPPEPAPSKEPAEAEEPADSRPPPKYIPGPVRIQEPEDGDAPIIVPAETDPEAAPAVPEPVVYAKDLEATQAMDEVVEPEPLEPQTLHQIVPGPSVALFLAAALLGIAVLRRR